MPEKEFLQIVRYSINAFRFFYTSPYFMDRGGKLKFSRRIRTVIYITAGILVPVTLYLMIILQPASVFVNSYQLLGFFRGCFHKLSTGIVFLWNIRISERASVAISKFILLRHDLKFSDKQIRCMTAIVIGQILYFYGMFSFSLYYIFGREGVNITSITRLYFAYEDFAFFCCEICFINLMMVTNKYAKLVNKEMEEVYEMRDKAFDLVFVRDLINAENLTPKEGLWPKAERIKRIRTLFGKIYDVKEHIHRVFSFPLLVTTTIIFGNLVFFVFLNTVQFKYGTNLTFKNFFLSCMVPIILSGKLFLVVFVCNLFKEQIRSAKLTAAKLLASSTNEEETETITGLVQELNYMDPEITCYGFAVIDYELISSIIGTIITYTVILLQTRFEDDGSDPVMNLLYEF